MKNYDNVKKGFTLAEILCALAIVGICTALALTLMKPAEKSAMKYLYMNAYQALEKAYYNASIKGIDPFSALPDEDGEFPVFTDTNDTGARKLCEGLTFYINTLTNKKDGEDDFSTTCSDSKLTSELADSFDRNNIQFTANNGMDFYISKMLTNTEKNLSFYLVFVDVNGEDKPNSIVYTYKGGKSADDYNMSDPKDVKQKAKDEIEPDIFAFAILSTGRICPLGIPEYDTNILTARFAYFTSSGDVKYTKESMAYYQAKGAAWGYYNSGVDNLEYSEDEAYTYNDIIRATINPDSKIVKDFPNLVEMAPVSLASEDPYYCSEMDNESCYIFLDTYRP